MTDRRRRFATPLLALAAGALHALSLEPWRSPVAQVLSLALLFSLALRAPSARSAGWLGWCFGLGWFTIGISWVYISMHVYGQMPAPIAALATFALAGFLSIYPALALWSAHRIARSMAARSLLALPGAFALAEWLRGTLLTGFPWAAGGYAHTDGPLAGWAPLLGVYGVGFAAALIAGAVALCSVANSRRRRVIFGAAAVIGFALAGAGHFVGKYRWTRPEGAPIRVKLVQANMPQELKFTAQGLASSFDDHWRLMQGERADLVALPESVFPLPLQLVPSRYLNAFQSYADERRSALVFGVFIEEPRDAYYNSAVGIAPGNSVDGSQWQRYSKRQLVPFGEFIPWGFHWFVDLMQMPIGDQERGALVQPPFELAGQRIAVNICYEDLFGNVIRAAWNDPSRAPTMMLNLSNLAWFEDSIALPQHLQISRMRVLETQTPMLRSTNTGVTAIIDADGRVTAQLPINQSGALVGDVQGFAGRTPFVRWGDVPGTALMIAAILGAALASRATAKPRGQ